MYSDEIQDALEEEGVQVGDVVRVERDGTSYEGRLMPRSAQGETGVLVLKLDNGYNTGIAYTDDTDIALVEEHQAESANDVEVPEPDPEKPDIAILHTGGTIASTVSYEEGGVKPALEPKDLLRLYPELFDEANVDSEVIAQMLSEDMEPAHWQAIAEAVAEHREKDGVIIGHGTDTMQYTAAALTFMLENIDVPVVLVGAQRSSDRPSSDAALNLLSAVEFIKEGVPGVYFCMHARMSDDTAAVHHGARVRKMHTSRRDAFQSIDTRPAAVVDHGAGEVTFTGDPETPDGAFQLRTALEEDVGLLKTRPGLETDDIEHHSGRDGLVVEGTGLGHLPVNAFDEHTEHHEDIL
ncbi:MAG: Glu-tRNA(Gln) amidotransferase subunit GatD, partial [Candidatus Nanohaloarchaea archaeon]|nr:Glu-tRNA(Gln) amidotransferase subunit GatD [Candidatus Nanohaloarchaea archaeon]